MLKDRRNLSSSVVDQWSEQILEHLFNSIDINGQSVIFGYVSFNNEVKCEMILKKLKGLDVDFAVPKVCDHGELEYYVIDSVDELEVGAYGILEPKQHTEGIYPIKGSKVLVPGVAFDDGGYRLGYGGGFYDRLIEKVADAVYIGLAYEMQLVKTLPIESHDKKMDKIITEKQVFDYI